VKCNAARGDKGRGQMVCIRQHQQSPTRLKRSNADEILPSAATTAVNTRRWGDLDGSCVTEGCDMGTPGVTTNPREATARGSNVGLECKWSCGGICYNNEGTGRVHADVQTLRSAHPVSKMSRPAAGALVGLLRHGSEASASPQLLQKRMKRWRCGAIGRQVRVDCLLDTR
jgi:hypothetical protein